MITIAGIQMQSVAGDVAANLAEIERQVALAAEGGAKLVIFPELCLTGYGAGEAIRSLAEAPDGPSLVRLGEIARQAGVAIVAGFPERDGDAIYNSAIWTDGLHPPAIYRKSHLWGDYEREIFAVAPASTVIFTHRDMRCGLLICYDVEFPENVRRLAVAGAQAIIVPTALPAGWASTVIADRMIATRAFENQVFVAYINHHGSDPLFSFAGSSRIAAPDGSLLAGAAPNGPAMLNAYLSPGDFAPSFAENTYLADLRRYPV